MTFMTFFQVSQSNNLVLLPWSGLPHLTYDLGLIWKKSKSHLWSEGLQCWETPCKRPVILEHKRIKQPYEKSCVMYIRFSQIRTSRLSSFIFLSPWNTGKLLKHPYAQLCWQRNIRVHSFTWRRQLEVSSISEHTYSLSLILTHAARMLLYWRAVAELFLFDKNYPPGQDLFIPFLSDGFRHL